MPWGKCLYFSLGYCKCGHLEQFCLIFLGFRAIHHIKITHPRESKTCQDIEMIKTEQKCDLGRRKVLIARSAYCMPDKVRNGIPTHRPETDYKWSSWISLGARVKGLTDVLKGRPSVLQSGSHPPYGADSVVMIEQCGLKHGLLHELQKSLKTV